MDTESRESCRSQTVSSEPHNVERKKEEERVTDILIELNSQTLDTVFKHHLKTQTR